MKEYIPLFLLMWWAFGVLLVFAKRDVWSDYYDKFPTLTFWPKDVVLFLVLAVCVVFFPLPMLAPFETARNAFKECRKKRRLKRALLKVFQTIKKGKGGEVEKDFDELIKRVKKL